MSFCQTESVALRQACQAILLRELNVATVTSITVVPTEHYRGRVEYRLMQEMPTVEDLKNRLVASLAAVDPSILGEDDKPDCVGAYRSVQDLAQRIADMENPTWRDTQGYLPVYLVESCTLKAGALVSNNEARIRKLAAKLIEKGELTGSDMVAFF